MLARSYIDRERGQIAECFDEESGEWSEMEYEDHPPQIVRLGGGPATSQSPKRDGCPTCGGELTVVGFTGYSLEQLCVPCFSRARPLARTILTPGSMAARRRRLRRTAHGTAAALPTSIYAEIRESGPCVYCGAKSEAADHVLALSRGGRDVRENLVPACAPCNWSKRDLLLTEWDADRTARAATISPVIAAELARLRSEPNQ